MERDPIELYPIFLFILTITALTLALAVFFNSKTLAYVGLGMYACALVVAIIIFAMEIYNTFFER